MKYKDSLICYRCNEKIDISKARIEWLKSYSDLIFIHLVHQECSFGYHTGRIAVSDIDLGNRIYTIERAYNILVELKKECVDQADLVDKIISDVFIL